MYVSVITPALNPRKEFILRVFKALEEQTLPMEKWEYIVVDSGSTPPLNEQLNLSWHPNACVLEAPEQRLAVSRWRGMQRAKGELIIFVDDDNVLAPNYLESAIAEMENHPFIGVLSGHVEGEFHGEIQPWMREFLPILGVTEYSSMPDAELIYALVKTGGPWVPAGSGMIVRRAIVEEYCRQVAMDPEKLSVGRVGKQLLGSDDVDLAYTAIDLAMAIGRSRKPKLIHLIPEARLTESYLVRLLYASNYATARLLVRRGWKKQASLQAPQKLQALRRLLSQFKKRTPGERCWAAFAAGYRDGLCGAPFDERYT